jgi:hypothetical protein
VKYHVSARYDVKCHAGNGFPSTVTHDRLGYGILPGTVRHYRHDCWSNPTLAMSYWSTFTVKHLHTEEANKSPQISAFKVDFVAMKDVPHVYYRFPTALPSY